MTVDELKDQLIDAAKERNDALASLKTWREWAQFTYIGGGPMPDVSDNELRKRVCEAHDKFTKEARQAVWLEVAWMIDAARKLRIDASGERGRMPATEMYALADRLDSLAVSGNQQPSVLRGDPGVPRTVNDDTRDKSCSDPLIQITLQALINEMREVATRGPREMPSECVVGYELVNEWANRLAALLPVRQHEETR